MFRFILFLSIIIHTCINSITIEEKQKNLNKWLSLRLESRELITLLSDISNPPIEFTSNKISNQYLRTIFDEKKPIFRKERESDLDWYGNPNRFIQSLEFSIQMISVAEHFGYSLKKNKKFPKLFNKLIIYLSSDEYDEDMINTINSLCKEMILDDEKLMNESNMSPSEKSMLETDPLYNKLKLLRSMIHAKENNNQVKYLNSFKQI